MATLRPTLGTGILSAAPARLGRRRNARGTSLISWFVKGMTAWRERRVLAQLPDYILDDIGLTRGDVESQLAKSGWSPVDWAELEQRRRQKRTG